MDTSPRDQRRLLPNAKPKAPQQPKPGERLFEFVRGHDRFLCELRDDGPYGVEAQFFHNEDFFYGRRFETRALAIQWAELEREAITKGT